MNLQESQDRIGKLMLKFVDEVRIANAMGKRDINCISENALIELFSKIYGHTYLKNLNVSDGSNYPAIDLGDKEARIAYQITATPGSQKIKRTLEKFVAHKLYEEYDRLVIYILTEKQSRYTGQGFEEIIQGKFSFDKDQDILDYRDLLNEISGFSLEESDRVKNILELHFGEGMDDDEPQDVMDWLEQVNSLWDDQSGAIKIDRGELRNDLQNFALGGNGVVIGSPGVGKTYLLNELHQHLKSDEIPHLLLPIDRLGDGTPRDLQSVLSYEVDLIDKLKTVPVSDKKAILLFDAFDAARNEQTRKRFLNLIRRAIQELENWNVVVTVRTYDAMKSQKLLDLFGNSNDTEYESKGILCHHFTIPPFNENEILQALGQIGCPKRIYNESSPDFKCILAKPFNIWLLEKILRNLPAKDLTTLSQISQICSEVELLDQFWQQRVGNEISEFVLGRIADRMVRERSLTVRVDDIYDDVDFDKPVRRTAWDNLQSDEILARVSSTGQRIAFSHNILFDYAISVLLIDDEPQHLENFILEDASRPLFLRPSLTYFFTRLWYFDPTSFWEAFWHIFPSEQSVHLRLVARLIPTSVIANEARNIDQLTPLLEKLQNREEIANEAVTRLLQSLQTLKIECDSLWSQFFDQISKYLHTDFAWDIANLTSDILERATKNGNKGIIEACGRSGRRLLEWVWQERETSEGDWYDRFGGRWAVPLVSKTYHTNVKKSRALLEKVLQLIEEDNFPIKFLSWLPEHVNWIWDYDPEFVTSIYCAVFYHDETSDVKTNLGSGSVLSMTSTRRQDYSMCRYRLVKHFPNFLRAAPSHATKAVIRSLNIFIIRGHIIRYLKEGVTLKDMVETFNFRKKPAYFMEDGSYIWDAQNSSDEPIEMGDALFEFIAELTMSEDSRLDLILDVFPDEVVVAFFWKRLLKTATQFPHVFAPRLFELCIAAPIQRHPEAFYELGHFLEAASAEFTPDQLRQIEESILAYPTETTDEKQGSLLERQRNRLLARIPANLLTTIEGKKIREDMELENNIPANQPLVSFSTSSGAVTEEKWLQTQGVDTTAPENQELQRFSGVLNKFGSDWLNDVPTQEAIELILPQLQETYATIKNNTEADQQVINLLWRNLTDCVAILGQIANNLESDSFAFCRQVLLEGAKHEEPKPDPEYDAQFNSPGYSPFPRHEAAEGLLRLAFYQPDAEILDAIEILARDPVPSVRMVTVMELFLVYDKAPEKFWDIVDNRAAREKNLVVQEYLYLTLTQVVGKAKENEDKTTRVMANLLQHTPVPPAKSGSFDPFSFLLMGLAIGCENPWALETIENTFFKDPVQFANLLTRSVNEVMKNYVSPKHFETGAGREKAKRAIDWLEKVIDVVSDRIKELYSIVNRDETEDGVKKLHDTYKVIDEVIMRLYFAVAHKRDQSEKSSEDISYELKCHFYNEVKPLMEQVIDFAQTPKQGVMFAPTAHYFMQVLKSFLGCNTKEVLHLAEGVVRSSEPFGYNLDAIAVQDAVEFVEIVLADYRHEVRDDEECLRDLLNLLDMFAKTGWPDALKLVWRLDEVFR